MIKVALISYRVSSLLSACWTMRRFRHVDFLIIGFVPIMYLECRKAIYTSFHMVQIYIVLTSYGLRIDHRCPSRFDFNSMSIRSFFG